MWHTDDKPSESKKKNWALKCLCVCVCACIWGHVQSYKIPHQSCKRRINRSTCQRRKGRARTHALLFIVSFRTSRIAGVIFMPRFISPRSDSVPLLRLSSEPDAFKRNLHCHFPLDVMMKMVALYRKRQRPGQKQHPPYFCPFIDPAFFLVFVRSCGMSTLAV